MRPAQGSRTIHTTRSSRFTSSWRRAIGHGAVRFARRPRPCHNAGVIRLTARSIATVLVAAVTAGVSTLGPAVHLHADPDGRSAAVLHRHGPTDAETGAAPTTIDHAESGPGHDIDDVFVVSRTPAPGPGLAAITWSLAVPSPSASWMPRSPDHGDRPIHGPPRAAPGLRAPPSPASLSR